MTTYLDVAGESADRSGLAVLVDPETELHQSTDVVLDAATRTCCRPRRPQRTEDRQRKVDVDIVDSATGLEFRSAYDVPPTVDDIYVSPTHPVDGRVLHADDPLAQGRADAEPRHAVRRRSASTPSSSRAARWAPGRTRPATVYAGNGATSDYQGVDALGKIVVVDHSDAVTPVERALAAATSGARALIVVNDGVGGLNEYVGSAPIPVARVHRDAGADLIALAKNGAKLTLAAGEVHAVRLRPDPRLPRPGAGPAAGLPPHEE